MPASWMRRAIHAGVGAAGSKPVTDRPVKTGQPTGSSTTTSYADLGRRRHRPVGRVGEVEAVGQRGLAADTAQRQRVRAVGVDLELDDLVAQRQHVEDVVARLAGVGGQHDDAVVVVAEAELLGGADHPGRHVAVGLARGDREVAGQHAAGQDHRHQVADGEVVGAAHDALRVAGAVGRADVDRAPADGLAVALRLVLEGQHPADDERSGDVVPGPLDRLELEAEGRQARGELLGGDVGQVRDDSTDPRNRGTHRGVRAPFRRRTRSGRRPRTGRAGPPRRAGTSGSGRCPCRTRTPCSARGRPRTR